MNTTTNPHPTNSSKDVTAKNRIRTNAQCETDSKRASNQEDKDVQDPFDTSMQAKFPNWTENWPHKREQLRRRVETRVGELEKSLEKLGTEAFNFDRSNAIKVELQLVQDAIGNGWEHVGEIEASKLGQWLEVTQYMTGADTADTDVANAEAEGDFPNPANQATSEEPTELPTRRKTNKKAS